jgi:hypothetical protein
MSLVPFCIIILNEFGILSYFLGILYYFLGILLVFFVSTWYPFVWPYYCL